VAKLPLSVSEVLNWADRHRRRTGRWPTAEAGPVDGAAGENWQAINRALVRGNRGLAGGSSLALLLAEHRGRRSRAQAPRLGEEQILLWADRHQRRTGRWPTPAAGPVAEAPSENWKAVASALYAGNRGLHGGETLARFLRRHGREVPDLRGRRRATPPRQVG
jgi:hypothetical protein